MIRRRHWKYFIYVFMALYVAYVAISMYLLNNLTQSGQAYGIQATREIRELRTRANEFAAILPILLASSEIPLADIKARIAFESEAQLKTFRNLEARFQGKYELMSRLYELLEEISLKKSEAASKLHDNMSYEVATTYYQNNIAPLINDLQQTLDEIHQSVDATRDAIHKSLHTRLDLVIWFTIVAGLIIVGITMLNDRRMAISSREIAYRDELFRQLARGVDEIFIIAKDVDNFEFVSPNSQRILGISSSAIQSDPACLYNALAQNDAAWLRKTISSPQPASKHTETDLAGKNNARLYNVRIYTIQVPSTKQKRFIIVLTDQTEAREHQLALTDALENANAASAAKSSFLSHMSHEIRTPMNAIIGMTTIALSHMQNSSKVCDCLQKISHSSRHLLCIINDILDMSKIEAGKLSINNDHFNLYNTIENIRSLLTPQIQAKAQNFDIQVKNIIEENLMGDAMRLRQILLNILSNAIKFTPESGTITLQIEQLPNKPNSVQMRFIISDTGIGMTPEFLERLYVPFEQAHSSTASKYGGTGLGMPITANLVHIMCGSINVSSTPGKGTTFYVELPFELSGESTQHKNELPDLRLLIVDDDKDARENASMLLSQMGALPVCALSSEHAIAICERAHQEGKDFKIAMIDWSMSDMPGPELGRRLKEAAGDYPLVIVISADDWNEIEKEANAAGINHFVTRPFFASALFETMSQALESSGALPGSPPSSPVAAQQTYDYTGKRILLAEDNEFNREIAEEFLSMVHATVEHAENGQAAVDKFIASPPGYYDIILMDIQMPILDGYEATRKIRAATHNDAASIPIIAMTANAFNEDIARATASGMTAHIAKPIDINALYKMLGTFFQAERDSPRRKQECAKGQAD